MRFFRRWRERRRLADASESLVVTLRADVSAFEEGMRRLQQSIARFGVSARQLRRSTWRWRDPQFAPYVPTRGGRP